MESKTKIFLKLYMAQETTGTPNNLFKLKRWRITKVMISLRTINVNIFKYLPPPASCKERSQARGLKLRDRTDWKERQEDLQDAGNILFLYLGVTHIAILNSWEFSLYLHIFTVLDAYQALKFFRIQIWWSMSSHCS